jgi:hypothetical protein
MVLIFTVLSIASVNNQFAGCSSTSIPVPWPSLAPGLSVAGCQRVSGERSRFTRSSHAHGLSFSPVGQWAPQIKSSSWLSAFAFQSSVSILFRQKRRVTIRVVYLSTLIALTACSMFCYWHMGGGNRFRVSWRHVINPWWCGLVSGRV